MRTRPLKLLPYGLLFIAALFIIDGCWIKVKASLAQVLLQKAWQVTLDGGEQVRPWPWADTWPVARLQVARLGVDCIVLEGENGEVLAFGPGHISKSSQPLAEGNCALVGHRDTSFSFLKDLQKGDTLSLQNSAGKELRYRVLSTEIKNHKELYFEETVTPWLTLITCYPFESLTPGGPLRFVVFAKEIITVGKAA